MIVEWSFSGGCGPNLRHHSRISEVGAGGFLLCNASKFVSTDFC